MNLEDARRCAGDIIREIEPVFLAIVVTGAIRRRCAVVDRFELLGMLAPQVADASHALALISQSKILRNTWYLERLGDESIGLHFRAIDRRDPDVMIFLASGFPWGMWLASTTGPDDFWQSVTSRSTMVA